MNPYKTPSTQDLAPGIDRLSNPAKPLLYLVGGFCLIECIWLVPTGLFVGLPILSVALAMFAFGGTAIWLGRRHFDSVTRVATIAWGASATLLILVAIAMEPPSVRDVPGLIFIGLVLLIIGAVPLVAFHRRPIEFRQ